MDRTILHADFNNFYASVECLYNPDLRDKPVAVGGDPEARHGIVLAKNMLAKSYGVQTGEALWQARQKCPQIVFVRPHFKRYLRFSKMARDIYCDYTPRIEGFGLDENWLDVTGSDGEAVANEIRERVKAELGITASVGVSWNKIFAKLGSDIKKPDATTVITRENYKDDVWTLPAGDLLMVGRATSDKLHRRGVHTIGQLANTEIKWLKSWIGNANANMLYRFANGLDYSPVMQAGESVPAVSIGNSRTMPRDLVNDWDIKVALYLLAESVSARLREAGFKCRTIQISIRGSDLVRYERQMKFPFPLCTTTDLVMAAFSLYQKNHDGSPVRSLGIRATDLVADSFHQLSILPEMIRNEREEAIERAMDSIRSRFGYFSIERGLMFVDRNLTNVNPREDHTIHPVGWR